MQAKGIVMHAVNLILHFFLFEEQPIKRYSFYWFSSGSTKSYSIKGIGVLGGFHAEIIGDEKVDFLAIEIATF